MMPKHKYSTRQKVTRNLEGKQHSTALIEKSVFFRGRKIWNDIPPQLRNTESTKTFKNKLQTMLLKEHNRQC